MGLEHTTLARDKRVFGRQKLSASSGEYLLTIYLALFGSLHEALMMRLLFRDS